MEKTNNQIDDREFKEAASKMERPMEGKRKETAWKNQGGLTLFCVFWNRAHAHKMGTIRKMRKKW
jgi:hypothetical protein